MERIVSDHHILKGLGEGGDANWALGWRRSRRAGPPGLAVLALMISVLGLAVGCGSSKAPPLPEVEWRGDSAEAQQQLDQALTSARESPEDVDAVGRLAMLLHAYDQNHTALVCYERARALDPGQPRWEYLGGVVEASLGNVGAARQSFQRALDLGPADLATRIRLAEVLLTGGEAKLSRIAFEGLVADRPTLAVAHYGLGRTLQSLGDAAAAIDSFQEAIRLSPQSGGVHYALAMAYRDSGAVAKASHQLAELQPEDRTTPRWSDPLMEEVRALRRDHHWHLSEGLRLEGEGRLEEAQGHYDSALQLAPDYAQAHVNLIAVHGKLNRIEQAEEHYRAALEIDPDSEELHVNWGMIEASRGRWQQAADSYRRALEISPGSAAAHVDLGMILLQRGEGPAAETHFNAALASEPANRLAHFHLGRQLVGRGRVAEGVEHLEQSLEPVDDRTPTFLYGLADAYLRAGDLERAARRGREALELATQFNQQELAQTISRGLRAIENAE